MNSQMASANGLKLPRMGLTAKFLCAIGLGLLLVLAAASQVALWQQDRTLNELLQGASSVVEQVIAAQSESSTVAQAERAERLLDLDELLAQRLQVGRLALLGLEGLLELSLLLLGLVEQRDLVLGIEPVAETEVGEETRWGTTFDQDIAFPDEALHDGGSGGGRDVEGNALLAGVQI